MPTRILPTTLANLDQEILDDEHIHFIVPVEERINQANGVPTAYHTLIAIGRLGAGGGYTYCEVCQRTPVRNYYVVGLQQWEDDAWVTSARLTVCSRCARERIAPTLLRDAQARIRAEGQRRRLAATRPTQETEQHQLYGDVSGPILEYTGDQSRVIRANRRMADSLNGVGAAAVATGEAARPLIQVLLESIEATDSPYQCQATDLTEIPNGEYFCRVTEGADWRFSIYTVRNSQTNPDLNGCRVMRYIPSGSHAWKAFAYILSDGTLQLWRRYQRYENSTWWAAAQALMAELNDHYPVVRVIRNGTQIENRRLGQGWCFTLGQIRNTRLSHPNYCNITVHCRVCNVEVDRDYYTIGLCVDHYAQERDAERTAALERETAENLERRQQAVPTAGRFGQPRRMGPLARDELGQGEIL